MWCYFWLINGHAWFPSTVWFKKKPCSHCQRFQHNDMKFMLSSGHIGTQHVQTHEIYACEFPALKYFRSCNCIWICLSFLFKCIDIMLSDILLRKKTRRNTLFSTTLGFEPPNLWIRGKCLIHYTVCAQVEGWLLQLRFILSIAVKKPVFKQFIYACTYVLSHIW